MKPVDFSPAAEGELDDALAVSPKPAEFKAAVDVAIATTIAATDRFARVARSQARRCVVDPGVIRVVAFPRHKRRLPPN